MKRQGIACQGRHGQIGRAQGQTEMVKSQMEKLQGRIERVQGHWKKESSHPILATDRITQGMTFRMIVQGHPTTVQGHTMTHQAVQGHKNKVQGHSVWKMTCQHRNTALGQIMGPQGHWISPHHNRVQGRLG